MKSFNSHNSGKIWDNTEHICFPFVIWAMRCINREWWIASWFLTETQKRPGFNCSVFIAQKEWIMTYLAASPLKVNISIAENQEPFFARDIILSNGSLPLAVLYWKKASWMYYLLPVKTEGEMQNQKLPIVIYLIQMLWDVFGFSLQGVRSVRKKGRMQQRRMELTCLCIKESLPLSPPPLKWYMFMMGIQQSWSTVDFSIDFDSTLGLLTLGSFYIKGFAFQRDWFSLDLLTPTISPIAILTE